MECCGRRLFKLGAGEGDSEVTYQGKEGNASRFLDCFWDFHSSQCATPGADLRRTEGFENGSLEIEMWADYDEM